MSTGKKAPFGRQTSDPSLSNQNFDDRPKARYKDNNKNLASQNAFLRRNLNPEPTTKRYVTKSPVQKQSVDNMKIQPLTRKMSPSYYLNSPTVPDTTEVKPLSTRRTTKSISRNASCFHSLLNEAANKLPLSISWNPTERQTKPKKKMPRGNKSVYVVPSLLQNISRPLSPTSDDIFDDLDEKNFANTSKLRRVVEHSSMPASLDSADVAPRRRLRFSSPSRYSGGSHPCNLPDRSCMIIATGQPAVVYDLLPTSIKNPSFLLRLDLVQPQSKLVIVHRTVRRKFDELDEEDRLELIQVAFDISKKFDINHSTLRIPIHCGCSKEGRTLFHAYLTVPRIEEFIKLFRAVVNDVPSWPLDLWQTSLWPERIPGESLASCYERGVRGYQSRGDDPETWFRQKNLTKSEGCMAFDMNCHVDQPLVGFSRLKSPEKTQVTHERVKELQALMDSMYAAARKGDQYCCLMCISTTGGYVATDGWKRNILGFLDYTDTEIPDHLFLQTGRETQKSSKGVGGYHSVYVMEKKAHVMKKEILDKWKSSRAAVGKAMNSR